MNQLPEQYVVNKLYQYSAKVKYQKSSNSYRGCCPACKEGESWGVKTRLNYYINQQFFLCYNCQNTWSPVNWIMEVGGLSYREVMQEAMEYDTSSVNIQEANEDVPKIKNEHTLPFDSINLCDPIQVKYYEDNRVMQDALKLIKTRRLDTAINKASAYYLSLVDYVHKNRLCIPFRDPDNKIRFYQTRALYSKDEEIAKYLSKLNSDKSVFGLDNIDPKLDHLFIFEGPIDSMFVRNGVSMAGLRISDYQKTLLSKYMLFKRIWILDNQLENNDVYEKNLDLIDRGETIFIWPKTYKGLKDLNEICCRLNLNGVNPDFFTKYAYSGLNAKTVLLQMRNA